MSKKPNKTRQRILETSLELFNLLSEPSVTTNAIANEADISPGNLHYHFPRKANLISTLFDEFSNKMHSTLDLAPQGGFDLEGFWWFQHLLFEIVGNYRFIVRDINSLMERYPDIEKGMDKLMQRERVVAAELLLSLREQGIVDANDQQISTLVESIVITLTYWLTFRRQNTKTPDFESEDIAEGIYQLISLVAPWMREPERSQTIEHAELYR
ncbi:MAG: TetR/AcrR family transcriptional regulator [Xanthomonadales bacterium]|nr:TetR/AcrR family transcriptional regulator [Xanthomonadales bacterium]